MKNKMNLSKQQRIDRNNAEAIAVRSAIKAYFVGHESAKLRWNFVRDAFKYSIIWFAWLVLGVSAAATISVTFGLNHESLLREFHAWMIATPVEQVISTARKLVELLFGELLKWAILFGVGKKLIYVVGLPMRKARQDFYLSLFGSVDRTN